MRSGYYRDLLESRCTCIVLSQNWLVKNTPVSAEEEKEEVETCKDSHNFGLFHPIFSKLVLILHSPMEITVSLCVGVKYCVMA